MLNLRRHESIHHFYIKISYFVDSDKKSPQINNWEKVEKIRDLGNFQLIQRYF